MKRTLVALAILLVACDDRRPQDDPEDAGIPECSLEGTPGDEREAQAAVEALLACEGQQADWVVTCSPRVQQWNVPGQPTPAGDDIVGHEVITCQATSERARSRTFEVEVGELRLRPVEKGLGLPRCVAEGTASAERFDQCDVLAADTPAEPLYPDITTQQAAYDHVWDLLSCAGCPQAEYQIDCWGPAERLLNRPDVRGWHLFACRLSDLVQPAQLYMLLPFATF